LSLLTKKLGPVVAAGALLASATLPSMAAPARAGASLLVYTHLTVPEGKVIQQLANQWAAKTGNTVKVINDQSSFQAFSTLARSGKGPDIMFGLPADNIGTFQLAGLLSPVPSGTVNLSSYVPGALPAVSFGGQQFAVPLMLDTYTLVYNKQLVPTPPKTFDDLIAIAKKFPNAKGQNYGFLYDITNFYYSYAFIKGFGGYVFKQNGASLDTSDIGLGNAGTINALTFFQTLVQKDKLIPPDINYNIASGLFQKGQLGMFIDGDWDIAANEKALGSNFAAAPLPLLPGGLQPHPFAGIQVGFVSAFSHHQDLSWQLIKYLLPIFSTPDFKAAGRLPALKSALAAPAIQGDPIYSAYAKTALSGDPLPNVPEMSTVWTPGANAITLVISGKETPQAAAANMVKQIKQGIAQLKS
jgi:arabinogalactan oligomer/maltooligosaccharide transport system substrate-binding protein